MAVAAVFERLVAGSSYGKPAYQKNQRDSQFPLLYGRISCESAAHVTAVCSVHSAYELDGTFGGLQTADTSHICKYWCNSDKNAMKSGAETHEAASQPELPQLRWRSVLIPQWKWKRLTQAPKQ